MARVKKQQPTGQRASLVISRALSGGPVWELNVYTPSVGGQRSNVKAKHLECPLDEADRLLATEGLMVRWTTQDDGRRCYYVGDVYNLAAQK